MPPIGSLTLDQWVSRLDSEPGRALAAELAGQLEPHLSDLPDPVADARAPSDSFHRALWQEARMGWVPAHAAAQSLPSLLRTVLGRFVDANQALDPQRLTASLGPQALAFLQRLQAAPEGSGRMTDRLVLDQVSRADSIDQLRHEDSAAPPMPTLDHMAEAVGAEGAFAGFSFFGLQHLFMSSVTLFDKLNQCGIAHDDMILLGKIYSTNFRAAAELEARGAKVAGASRRIGAVPFEKAMRDDIMLALRRLVGALPHPPVPGDKPTVLLIDDGGEAIELLHHEFRDYAHYFVCVEQTRRGARKLKHLELACPVVNVAETWAKLTVESPMIGHSVVFEVARKLDSLAAANVERPRSATVLGFGAVGQAVAKSLRERGLDVVVYDRDPARVAEATAQGFLGQSDKAAALQRAQVLVSCVGERTLDQHDIAHLPSGAVLFNAASADDELGPEQLRPYTDRDTMTRDEHGRMWTSFGGKPLCLGLGEAQAHCDRVVTVPSGQQLLLVNDGFVCNMTGERDPIPARYIQLTRTLLFLGAVWATRQSTPGVFDLPLDWQQATVNLTQLQLARTGEDLLAPSWERHETAPAEDPPRPPTESPQRERVALATAAASDEQPVAREIGRKIYGYKIGAVAPRTFEATVSSATGGDGRTLTLPAAALHAAALAINQKFHAELHPTMRLSSSSQRLVSEPGAVSAADDLAAFEVLYARFAVDLLRTHLTRQNRVPPSPAQLAMAIAQLEGLPAVAVLRGLQASARPGDLQLAECLSPAKQA